MKIVATQHKILFAKLYESSEAFAAEAHKENKKFNPKKPILSCTKKSTLGEVVSTLASFRRHRLFIVDEEGKPIGVISLGDVLTTILQSKK